MSSRKLYWNVFTKKHVNDLLGEAEVVAPSQKQRSAMKCPQGLLFGSAWIDVTIAITRSWSKVKPSIGFCANISEFFICILRSPPSNEAKRAAKIQLLASYELRQTSELLIH